MHKPIELPPTEKAFAPIPRSEPILCPPGKYYIGDPSTPLSQSWLFKDAWAAFSYESPAYFRSQVGMIIVAETYEEGDGRFQGSDYREYIVKTGRFGIVNMDFINLEALTLLELKRTEGGGGRKQLPPLTLSSLTEGGHIHTFSEPFVVNFLEHGLFTFLTPSGMSILILDTRQRRRGYDENCECEEVCECCEHVPVPEAQCIECGEPYNPETTKGNYYSEEPMYTLYCSKDCEEGLCKEES